jgi:hypothetical protein
MAAALIKRKAKTAVTEPHGRRRGAARARVGLPLSESLIGASMV